MDGAFVSGTRLKGRYVLERLLGRGGMAAVWLASDEVLERPVAVKVLSDTIASDPEFQARFRREAQIAAGVSHPNLIDVYDYAEGVERPYLVMEYVPGEDLARRRERGAAIDCKRLARELLGALAHIHAAGIVHRDVKPQNVLLGGEGAAKLIDFGIALPADATALTRTGHLLGTARYIAPEVMRGEAATARSDLYSCGVVLRDCLGDRPAAPLRSLVERLASADPQARPASAEAALALLGGGAPASEKTAVLVRAPASHPPGGRLLAVAAGLAALLGAFLLIDGGGRQEPSRSDSPSATAGKREPSGETPGTAPEPAAEVPEPAGEDPALGASLNQEGFELIQAGRPEEAVPLLEEAVRAFPPDTEDLDYAYALFNLGNALRLSGRPQDAVPVLERRLEIPNQTDVVRRELATARDEVGP